MGRCGDPSRGRGIVGRDRPLAHVVRRNHAIRHGTPFAHAWVIAPIARSVAMPARRSRRLPWVRPARATMEINSLGPPVEKGPSPCWNTPQKKCVPSKA
jgi:hypothetical protein